MKTKLIITILLWALIIGFYLKDKNYEKKMPVVHTESVKRYNKLSYTEQKERFEYLLSAESHKYESERDFKLIETGSVIEDNSEFGAGAEVVYCKAGKDKAGYLVKGMKRQLPENKGNKWLNDTMHSWYVRPLMRIKQELVYPLVEGFNQENGHTKICRLEVVDARGKVVKEIEYEGRDFWERQPDVSRIYYSGRYNDKFGLLKKDSLAVFSGSEINPKGRKRNEGAGFDVRVYWYGYTDMWLDYVKVENDVSVKLFLGRYDYWLESIDSIKAENLNNIKNSQNVCIDYIMGKLNGFNLTTK